MAPGRHLLGDFVMSQRQLNRIGAFDVRKLLQEDAIERAHHGQRVITTDLVVQSLQFDRSHEVVGILDHNERGIRPLNGEVASDIRPPAIVEGVRFDPSIPACIFFDDPARTIRTAVVKQEQLPSPQTLIHEAVKGFRKKPFTVPTRHDYGDTRRSRTSVVHLPVPYCWPRAYNRRGSLPQRGRIVPTAGGPSATTGSHCRSFQNEFPAPRPQTHSAQ